MRDKKFPKEFETVSNHPSGLTKDPRYYATFLNIGDTLDWRPNYLSYFQDIQSKTKSLTPRLSIICLL